MTRTLKIVGMAFQAPTLLPWRTTLDNVLLPLEIVEPYRSTFKRDRAKFADQARALLATVGLKGYEDKFPWQLSGGMQQRASICRALIHQPKMLMLDEPFGALDAFTREELWCVLRDLQATHRFTVILVTHDLREAVFLADTVYVMSKRPGRILAKRSIDLPRPRDLEVTYSDPFTALVHEMRERIGMIRKNRMTPAQRLSPGEVGAVAAERRHPGALAVHLLGVQRLRVHLPLADPDPGLAPPACRRDRRARVEDLLDDDGRLRDRRRGRRGPRRAGRQLALHLQRALPAARRVQQHPQGGVRPDPRRLVRDRHGARRS